MSHGYTARATWALEVPPGEVLVPADKDLQFPVTIRISMAAIDPTEEPIIEEGETAPRIPRSTLKIVRLPPIESDDEDENEEDGLSPEELKELRALLATAEDDSDSDEDEDGKAGPSNSKDDAGVKKLTEALKGSADDSDEDMDDAEEEDTAKPNGVKKNKGKAKATEEEDEDSESDLGDSDDDGEPEVAVICTLDTERNYQQPLDIILPAHENVGFIVAGTHSVFLTGNLVTHIEEDESDSEEEGEDYDLEPDSDELMEDSEDESDILDGQRVTEVDTDEEEEEEEAPKLVPSRTKKDSKKRPAEDEPESLDNMMKAEEKLSKKQLKKMKNNKGDAVQTKEDKPEKKAEKTDKKVQFAKNLEQGPTGSEAKKAVEKKPASNVTVVNGIKLDDRKIGQGRKAKAGDTVGMRYIGKLENGKVFDANKKGPPFKFKLGKGEVIKGWDIGIAGMAVGGERRLTIPAKMAYGNKALPDIPANSTLIFDVKMLEIK